MKWNEAFSLLLYYDGKEILIFLKVGIFLECEFEKGIFMVAHFGMIRWEFVIFSILTVEKNVSTYE